MILVYFGGFHDPPTQHWSYSAKDTVESVNYMEIKSQMKHVAIATMNRITYKSSDIC